MPTSEPTLTPQRRIQLGEWLWLAAVVLVVSMHFWFPHLQPGTPHDSYSTSAEGKKALYLLLRQKAELLDLEHVQRTFAPLHHRIAGHFQDRLFGYAARGDVLAVLGPARNPTAAEWNALFRWVEAGGALVIAAHHERPELSLDQVSIRVVPLETAIEGERFTDGLGNLTAWIDTEKDVYWRSEAEIIAPAADPLIQVDDSLQAVVQQHGKGRVVVVASDFIFWNQSLAWESNPELAIALLEAMPVLPIDVTPAKAIYLDESLNFTGTPKVVGLLLEPPLRSLTIQAFALVLLFAWWRSRRFGPIAEAQQTGRHNLVDHTDAVGIHAWKARSAPRMVKAYLDQLRRELRLGQLQGHEERILEPAARRLNRPVAVVQKLLDQAERATQVRKLDRRTAVELIRRLALLRRAAQIPKNS